MKTLSIRFKLIVGGLVLLLVPLIITGWMSTRNASNALKDFAYMSTQTKAESTALAVSEIVQGQKRLVWSLASDALVQKAAYDVYKYGLENTSDGISLLQKKFKETYKTFENEALGIFLTDTKGNLYMGIREGGKEYKGSNIQSRSYFQEAKRTGKPVVSDIVKSKSTGKMISVAAAPVFGPSGEFLGVYAIAFKADWYGNVVVGQKFGQTGYAFMVNDKFFVVAHKDSSLVLMDMSSTPGLMEMAADVKKGKKGAREYVFKGIEKIGGFAPVHGAPWRIVVNQNRDEVFASTIALRNNALIVFVVSVLVIGILIFVATSRIVGPINKVVSGLKGIAQGEGDLTMRLDVASKDELGELAYWFNVFMEKMQSIIALVSKNTNEVDTASRHLTGIANDLNAHSQNTSDRANNVATATEELNATVTSVAAAMEQSSTNTSTVASASEEMSATIAQIASNVHDASEISDTAVLQAQQTSKKMGELEDAAQAISKVTDVITDISEKTNLLALNATIEAARAGEAGKGFAVVATEIKELASQTAEATNDIKEQISGIQGTSHVSIAAIDDIVKIINQINNIISTITASVGEQSTATQEITANITQASQGLVEINESMNQGAAISAEISHDITQVSGASGQITDKSSDVSAHANDLQELAEKLKGIVNSFKI